MKYSDYINSVHFKHKSISYNLLTKNSSDNKKIKVTGQQAFNLIKPYCTSRIYEQMKAVIPLALYLSIVSIFCFTISSSRFSCIAWRFNCSNFRTCSFYGRPEHWIDALWNNNW